MNGKAFAGVETYTLCRATGKKKNYFKDAELSIM